MLQLITVHDLDGKVLQERPMAYSNVSIHCRGCFLQFMAFGVIPPNVWQPISDRQVLPGSQGQSWSDFESFGQSGNNLPDGRKVRGEFVSVRGSVEEHPPAVIL